VTLSQDRKDRRDQMPRPSWLWSSFVVVVGLGKLISLATT
jgi:hypothetical protein